MKLNLGCDAHTPDGWINVDYALGARFMKIPFFRAFNKKVKLFNLDWNEKIFIHNLIKRFPWGNESADVVYSSHTLEHFSKADGRKYIAECHRVLRKNGIIRIVVPDLRYYINEYMAGRIYADDFLQSLCVFYERSNNNFKHLFSRFFLFQHHKCMYDSARLIEILHEVGFDASQKDVFDSEIDDIKQVELEGRTHYAVVVEGRKR